MKTKTVFIEKYNSCIIKFISNDIIEDNISLDFYNKTYFFKIISNEKIENGKFEVSALELKSDKLYSNLSDIMTFEDIHNLTNLDIHIN